MKKEMIKKLAAFVLCICVCFSLSSCGEKQTNKEDTTTSQTTENSVADEKADLDLTVLNSTMVYSQICNMLQTPDNYIGKVIKIKGPLGLYTSESTGQNYYAVLVDDATACCQQGMEFIWNGEHKYPDDYPALGEEIEVMGEFQTYVENGVTYCHLVCDDVNF